MPIVYKSRVFSVEEARVVYPDGSAHDVAVVRHPPSVVLVPVREDGRVVLIRQYRPALARTLWELPAGSLNPSETATDAAVRECEEEVGLVPRRLERLCSLYPTPGFCDEELIFFRATDLHPPAPGSRHRRDEDERIEVFALEVAEAKALVARGEVVDLKTAYGLSLI